MKSKLKFKSVLANLHDDKSTFLNVDKNKFLRRKDTQCDKAAFPLIRIGCHGLLIPKDKR